jgi:hypothetical protein
MNSTLCLSSFEISWRLAITPSHLILYPDDLVAMDCVNRNIAQTALGFHPMLLEKRRPKEFRVTLKIIAIMA